MLTASRLRLLWLAALTAAAVAPLRMGLSAAPGLAVASREVGGRGAGDPAAHEGGTAPLQASVHDVALDAAAEPAKTADATKTQEAPKPATMTATNPGVPAEQGEKLRPVPLGTAKAAEPAKQPATKPPEPAKPAATKPAEAAKPDVPNPAEPAKPAATKPAEPAKPVAVKPAEPAKPAEAKPPEPAKPAATKPAEPAKPAAAKPGEPAKPAAAKPGEPAKPAVTNPAEPAKAAGTKPAEPAKPAAVKPAEPAKPAVTKPAEPAKPAAAKPGEPAKPAATKPAEPAKPAVTKPAEPAKPATAKPGEPAKPAVTKPAEPAKAAGTKPAESAKPAAVKPAEPAKPAGTKPAEPAKPAGTKPAEPAKPAATKPAEPSKPAVTKPAEAVKPATATGGTKQGAKVVKRDASDSGLAERPARILAVVPYNSRSHFVMYAPLFRVLAARGHTVHVLSHFPLENPPPNYHDFSVQGSYESWEDNVDMDLITASTTNGLAEVVLLWSETLDVCSKAIEHPSTRRLLDSTESYDLVITEAFGTECMTGFAHKFQAPLVTLISSVAPPGSLDRMGNPDHPAYTANYFLPYTEHMTFWQRLVNTFHGWAVRRLKYLLCDRPTDALARRYFGPSLPSTTELIQNTSLILVNSHFSINQVRPMVPGVVEVGGLHIGEPKPLPEELERWVSESEAGVVVFSLGTMVRVSTWSEERLRALWGALGALPQRVIIKSRDPLPSAPPNVRVERWLPQLDLLSHPKVVAFVTHGGLMGTQEAVWAGVPLLGIPMFGDQRLNLNTFAAKGVAVSLEYDELSEERLADALRRLIQDPGYRERMRALSRQFRDRPRAALESAVWWLEYVLRHAGATHLRSAAADMPLHRYLLLDVAAAAALGVALLLAVVWLALAAVYRFLRFGSKGDRRRRLPSFTATGQRKRYSKTLKQH